MTGKQAVPSTGRRAPGFPDHANHLAGLPPGSYLRRVSRVGYRDSW
jgi:hypothetical protein